jgi:hypothetical protein
MSKTAKSDDRLPYNVVRLVEPDAPKPSTNSRKDAAAEAIEVAIHNIQVTWRKLARKELHGSYGKRQLLQDIYEEYCGWKDDHLVDDVHAQLKKGFGLEPDADVDIINLLIQDALPEVAMGVVRTWTEAIRYGEHRHVRRWKLRAFLYVQCGLVRCARLYRELPPEDRLTQGPYRR